MAETNRALIIKALKRTLANHSFDVLSRQTGLDAKLFGDVDALNFEQMNTVVRHVYGGSVLNADYTLGNDPTPPNVNKPTVLPRAEAHTIDRLQGLLDESPFDHVVTFTGTEAWDADSLNVLSAKYARPTECMTFVDSTRGVVKTQDSATLLRLYYERVSRAPGYDALRLRLINGMTFGGDGRGALDRVADDLAGWRAHASGAPARLHLAGDFGAEVVRMRLLSLGHRIEPPHVRDAAAYVVKAIKNELTIELQARDAASIVTARCAVI